MPSSRGRRLQTTKKQICDYWNQNIGLFTDLDPDNIYLSERQCFACGNIRRLERAHILPRVFGGSDMPENLHILCGACHLESEQIHDKAYWNWFKYKRQYEYKCIEDHAQDWYKKIGFDYEREIAAALEKNNGWLFVEQYLKRRSVEILGYDIF